MKLIVISLRLFYSNKISLKLHFSDDFISSKWYHSKENIWERYYFIKTKIVDQKIETKMNFISFLSLWKLLNNIIFSRRSKLSFQLSSKHPLSQSFYNDIEQLQKIVLVYNFFLSNYGHAPAIKVPIYSSFSGLKVA